MSETAYLVISEEERISRRVGLMDGTHIIGSDPGCDIVVESDFIAPRQVSINVTPDQVAIEPVDASSGTLLVSGLTIDGPRQLSYPQTLDLGPLSIEIRSETSDSSPAKFGNRNRESVSDYEPGKEIARGGMGKVIEANQTSLERSVAMKMMLPKMLEHEDLKQRFIREAKVMGRLEHPNIVPVHELSTDANGVPFYTMKKVDGHTFQAVIDGLKSDDPVVIEQYLLNQLLSIFRKVCDAIAFAHSRGVIHRDLKPENIMIGEFGEVLVMDWGLAKLVGEEGTLKVPYEREIPNDTSIDLTLEGSVIGSPHYMSSEQAEGLTAIIDERSDIFSLGGILYSILALQPAFTGNSVHDVLDKVREGKITSPIELSTGKKQKSSGDLEKLLNHA